jgi:subtilisin family serine protease
VRRHLTAHDTIIVTLTALLGLIAPAGISAAQPLPAITQPHAPNKVLVGFRPGVSAAHRAAAAGKVGALASARLTPSARSAVRLELPRRVSVAQALKRLRGLAEVSYAEPDYLVEPAVIANDTYYASGSLWGMYGDASVPANTYGSGAAEAWAQGYTGSRQVFVGIVDEGVQLSHPDLGANVWTNPFEIAGDRLDNDGNGFVDDVHGWDFANNDASVYDGGSTGSLDDHGTHVAGTIGGLGGNGAGVAGVSWRVTMIPAKFMDVNGGYISDAIRALDYLSDLHRRHGLNIVAANNSWGGGGFSQALLDAIERAGDAGILFVAAAGNSATDNDVAVSYPANYQCTRRADGSLRGFDCVLSVAALTSTGSLASFSAYGAGAVDLAAPGASISSTVPYSRYATYSGTSMATPHVTGALALCASIGGLGAADLRAAVMSSATRTAALVGKTVSSGRLDVGAMVHWCQRAERPVSGAPSGLVATALGTGSASLAWINGAHDEDSFEIEMAVVSGVDCAAFGTLARTEPDATAYQVDGLLAGTEYCFRVRAANSYGGGSYSDWSNVARVRLPVAPKYACAPAPYAWTDASGQSLALADDGAARLSLPSGFGFAFYGQPQTYVDISANGYLAIGGDATSAIPWSNTSLPSADQPNGVAAAWWDDLNPNNETHVWTQVTGAAPDRIVVVEWRDIRPFAAGATSGVTFQVRLEEATDAITLSYKDVSAGLASFDGGASATVGLEDQLGVSAAQVSYNSNVLTAGTSYRCTTDAVPIPPPDTSAPAAVAPAATLASGQVLGSKAKVRLEWPAASDPSGIASYELQYRVGSGSWTTIGLSSPTALAVDFGVSPGQPYAFRVGARDGAGNVGWSSASNIKLALHQESSGNVRYSGGSFRLTTLDGASGGKVRATKHGGRVARLTFSGNGVAFVTTRSPKRGIVELWLDGAKVATLDLYAAARQTRIVAWAAALPAGAHVLEARITGTRSGLSGSARIDIDAFVVQQ